jgi:hypothetical protein
MKPKRKKKPGWHVQTRHDLKRRKLGIPADPGPALARHRRARYEQDLEAKRPCAPRSVQRAARLAVLEAKRQRAAIRHAVIDAIKPRLVPEVAA